MTDSPTYQNRRARFDNLLTLFGRKPVLEALRSNEIQPVRLHFSTDNRDAADLREMREIAKRRNVAILRHTRRELSRISKNGRQDQGVAVDIKAPRYLPIEDLLRTRADNMELIAVDSVTNPQNLGMIIRAVAASPLHGIIIARKGSAHIDGLVIKASAGALFKCRIYHCNDLDESLRSLQGIGFRICGLDSHGDVSIDSVPLDRRIVFVLGNETAGLSPGVAELCDGLVRIPLANGVESLNVSIAGALIAFRAIFTPRADPAPGPDPKDDRTRGD
jgi:23S rRNA (guanosine2251-2'-O)-methyltransferase